jgi:hypothetical protein
MGMKGSNQISVLIGLAIAAQAAIIGAVVYVKSTSRTAMVSQTAAANQTGFVKTIMPSGAIANEVLIVGPNCDRPEGLRTKALADSLAKLKIPYRQTSSISLNSDSMGSDDVFADISQMDQLMAGDSPVVFINAKGKANPTIDEVLAEYRLIAP